jgi:hypothetical protein
MSPYCGLIHELTTVPAGTGDACGDGAAPPLPAGLAAEDIAAAPGLAPGAGLDAAVAVGEPATAGADPDGDAAGAWMAPSA